MKSFQQRIENNEFLQWLAPSYWEVEDIRWNYVSQRIPGTLHWITKFPEFESWRTVGLESGSASLWLKGNPGIGKSMLSACMVEVLERAYPTVLYFFCRNTDPKLRRIRDIITILAYQLSRRIPEVRHQLRSLQLDGVSPKKIKSNILLAGKLLQMPWPKTSPEVFILLDGLDECYDFLEHSASESADIEKFLSLLMTLPNSRILITSRPNQAIANVLSHSEKEIGVNNNKEDIDLYIAYQVRTIKHLDRAFTRVNIDPVEYLGSRANGNFLWTQLILLEAEKSRTMMEFRSVLEAPVPQQLSRIYQRILDRLELARLEKFVKELLIWTLDSERILEVQELQTAMELSLEEEYIDFREILETNLRSLVEIVASPLAGSLVRIIHNSLRDFITDPLLCSSSYFINPSFIQSHIAEICMRHLSQSRKRDSFTQYAALNWMEHINRAQEESVVTSHLLECFYKFFHGDGLKQWLIEEILRDRSDQFYDYDIHSIVIGLRSWIRKVINSSVQTSSSQSRNRESDVISEKMCSTGSVSDAYVTNTLRTVFADIAEPLRCQLIQWMIRITESGTHALHKFIGGTLARIWIHISFEDCKDIISAFKMAWKCLYLSNQRFDDEDDEIWKMSKKSGKRLIWNKSQSSGEIIDMSSEFGYDESHAICSLNVAVALAEYKFDSDAVTYLETATVLEPSLGRYFAVLGVRACKDRRPQDALLYFEFAYSESDLSSAFRRVVDLPAKRLTPMHYTALGGYLDAIRALKEAGEDVSAVDAHGRLPVHYAAGCGHVEII